MSDDDWLVLRFTNEDMVRLIAEATYVYEQYQTKRKSVYETTIQRILRGFVAEDLLATHRGVRRADPTHPQDFGYDVFPDIEVRTVVRPDRIDHWDGVSLTLYERDQRKIGRRWVLALLDYDRQDVRYLGWGTGRELLLPQPVTTTSRRGKPYQIIGQTYPDQLRSMATL